MPAGYPNSGADAAFNMVCYLKQSAVVTYATPPVIPKPGWTQFLGASLNPTWKQNKNKYRPPHKMYHTIVSSGKTWSECSLDGNLTFEEGNEFIKSVEGIGRASIDLYYLYSNNTVYPNSAVVGWTVSGEAEKVDMSVNFLGDAGIVISNTADQPTNPTCLPIFGFNGGFDLKIDGVAVTKVFNAKVEVSNMWKQEFFNQLIPQMFIQTPPDAKFSAQVPATADMKALCLTNTPHTIEFTSTQIGMVSELVGEVPTNTPYTYVYKFEGKILLDEPGAETIVDDTITAMNINGDFTLQTCVATDDLVTVTITSTRAS